MQSASVDPNSDKRISEDVEKKCIAANVSIYNNLAATLLQTENCDFEKVKKYADIVIELDDTNEKAWFRKGQALAKLKDFSAAKICYEKVVKLQKKSGKDSSNTLKQIRDCEVKIKESEKREKAMYQNMFKWKDSKYTYVKDVPIFL